MNDDHTQHQPVEPTTPVEPEYVKAYMSGLLLPQGEHTAQGLHYGAEYIGIPPPPPKRRRVSLGLLVVYLIIAVLLFLSAGLFYLARSFAVSQEKPTPIIRFVPVTPTPGATVTPTARPYTAQDILNKMAAQNLIVGDPQYGEPLRYFYNDLLYTDVLSVPFQSSLIWQTVPYKGDCYESCAGVWVYSSYTIATAVYRELIADTAQAEQTPPQGPTRYPNVMLSGRCVADNVNSTLYAPAIQQVCV